MCISDCGIVFINNPVQDSRVLHCYNAHNDYVISLKGFNEVCSNVIESHHPSLLDVSSVVMTTVDHITTL